MMTQLFFLNFKKWVKGGNFCKANGNFFHVKNEISSHNDVNDESARKKGSENVAEDMKKLIFHKND